MIDQKYKLSVINFDGTQYNDFTMDAVDFIRDNFQIGLKSVTDYLYLGYSKPFGASYIELVIPNTVPASFIAEYYDGTAWQSLTLQDETRGCSRSGFIQWDKSNMKATTINGVNAYFIRLQPTADTILTTYRGINIVFSDDAALKREFFEIDDANLLPPGETSHISAHVASRDMIIQSLRNMGYIKENASSELIKLTPWDLHDIFEIKQAATYLALSKIFFNLSDSTEDNWWRKYREYHDKFEESFRIARISLDSNDDGIQDTLEKQRKARSWSFSR